MSIQNNIKKLETALTTVKSHCMCLELIETKNVYFVYLPEGFSLGAIQCSKQLGKIQALTKILNRMELEWKNSFP